MFFLFWFIYANLSSIILKSIFINIIKFPISHPPLNLIYLPAIWHFASSSFFLFSCLNKWSWKRPQQSSTPVSLHSLHRLLKRPSPTTPWIPTMISIIIELIDNSMPHFILFLPALFWSSDHIEHATSESLAHLSLLLAPTTKSP